ncbi:MAG: hypothetical protein JOZ10_06915 [Acidobacteria bacterium]|nr:hypothetical protein [Acidobacteriota bacterium]MBV9146627.1 hypothetical protein [Acidobacteriota bacterium]MBV9435633.1 hypothetical protein [Acidobacteriota bacterium]
MKTASRAVSFCCGLLVLYTDLASLLSGMPDYRAAWVKALCWIATVSLFAGALTASRIGNCLIILGSAAVLSIYVADAARLLLLRLGYAHTRARLVVMHDIPRWRIAFDRPVFVLLFFFAIASLVLALARCRSE